ncbi:MAG: AMP-binding protein, partial [Spirillospora sp.]
MDRPLHAAVLPPGPPLLRALAAALDGGPAICPLSPGLPEPALRDLLDALAPDAILTPDGLVPHRPHRPRGGFGEFGGFGGVHAPVDARTAV